MSRIPAIDPATAVGKAHDLFSTVKGKLGLVPNMTRVMANSPAVLEGYLGLSGLLGRGSLPPKIREELALAIAQDNECDYCLSAHTAIGKMVGLTPQEFHKAAMDIVPIEQVLAAITFAKRVLATRGAVSGDELSAVRTAGFSDREIAEIIAHVALNVFTNYFNKATDVDIDFPVVSFRKAN